MADQFDTSWFKLKNYESFGNMSIEEWQLQLSIRTILFKQLKYNSAQSIEIRKDILKEIELGVMKRKEHPKLHLASIEKLCSMLPPTPALRDLKSIDLWKLVRDFTLTKIGVACEHYDKYFMCNELNDELANIACTAHSLNIKEYFRLDRFNVYYIAVNIETSDEQLKEEFADWLKRTRAISQDNEKRKFLKQADFDQWVATGVIPYLDLTLASKLEGKTITQNRLGALIFPGEFNIDLSERIRKVTKPLAEWLLNEEIYRLLSFQIEQEKKRNKNQRKNVPE